MAARASGDRPGNRAIEGPQDSIAPDSGAADLTLVDTDQTVSDRDLASGGERRRSAGERVRAAADRDAAAHARDTAALARDQIAAAHDHTLAARDASRADDNARAVTGREIVLRAAEQRRRAAADRTAAAEARARAAADREHAARDREQAARDRLHSHGDREALVAALALAGTDPLTGARTRDGGLANLDHEIERAHRTTSLLSIAYVHVVGLKALNDARGHAAGDALLIRVVAVIFEHLRSYDLIIRLDGDEFLCAMSNLGLGEARERFTQIAAALAATPDARGIRTGFAEITFDDTAPELIARADRELIDTGDHPR